MDRLRRDFAISVRRLHDAPAFAVIAVLLLAFGVGVNAAVFGVVDPFLLRKLPVTDPDRLVQLHSVGTLHANDVWERAAVDRFVSARDVFDGVVAVVGLFEHESTYRDRRSKVLVDIVSSNYFNVLGVRPHLGSLLSDDDDARRRANAVLGYSYWMRVFGGDADVIGRPLIVNGRPHTIVGVGPRGFSGLRPGSVPDVYVPIGAGLRSADWVQIVGRLRHDLTPDQARVRLEPTFLQITAVSQIPAIEIQQSMSRLLVASIAKGLPEFGGRFGTPALMLSGVVGLVLLVAVANLSTLLLTRAAARRREIAVRRSLGATSQDIIRLFLVEGIVVSTLGTLVGTLLAKWAGTVLAARLLTEGIAFEPDGGFRLLVFSAVLMAIAVLGCAVLPAIASSRADVVNDLRFGTYGRGTGRIGGIREGLVVAQIAGSMVLLTGTALLVESLSNLYAADVGFDPRRVLSLSMSDIVRNRPAEQAERIRRDVTEAVQRLPGVETVGFAGLRPFSRSQIGLNVFADDITKPVHTLLNGVTSRYFAALGIPLVSGRSCAGDQATTSTQEVVINERLARQLFGRVNIQQRPLRSVEGERQFIVVGVVGDTIYNSVREPPRSLLYMCQPPASLSATMFVRAINGRADRLAPAVDRVLRRVAGDVQVANVMTLDAYLRAGFTVDRLVTTLLSLFTLLALGIAVVGLYGVLAGMVMTRVHEIGVRIALGAGRRHVAAVVGRPAARLVLAGLFFGTIGALASAPILSGLLFRVSSADPIAYASTIAMMVVTGALASYLPARRATQVDPVDTLRME